MKTLLVDSTMHRSSRFEEEMRERVAREYAAIEPDIRAVYEHLRGKGDFEYANIMGIGGAKHLIINNARLFRVDASKGSIVVMQNTGDGLDTLFDSRSKKVGINMEAHVDFMRNIECLAEAVKRIK